MDRRGASVGRGRGRGNVNGRGSSSRGGGATRGRGAKRGQRLEKLDAVASRSEALVSKRGLDNQTKDGVKDGPPLQVLANYYPLISKTDFCVLQYRVDFKPEEVQTKVKKYLLQQHRNVLPQYIFDGSTLFLSNKLVPEPRLLYSVKQDKQKSKVEITVKFARELKPTDPDAIQLYNIICRTMMESTKMCLLGRNFFDPKKGIKMENYGIEIWPGYKCSIRQHENQLLLGVDSIHKVLRLDTVLQVMQKMGMKDRETIEKELMGQIVLTRYHEKTYRIDDIDWKHTPNDTFDDSTGSKVRYCDYFKNKYQHGIKVMDQPLLISRPKKKDYHRGDTQDIHLIPELCYMTGLTDEMRSNRTMMTDISANLHSTPPQRKADIGSFIARLTSGKEIVDEMKKWGLQISNELVKIQARTLNDQKLQFGQMKELETKNGDFTFAFTRNKMKMLVRICMTKWILIIQSRDAGIVEQLISSLQYIGESIDFPISKPLKIMTIQDSRPSSYIKAIDQALLELRGDVQMIFAVLPTNNGETYGAVKRHTLIDNGIVSQCLLLKNARAEKSKLMSICTKVAIQMNAKLGGEPWSVKSFPKNSMVIGFDVYHCGKRQKSSVGALVSTINQSLTRFHSTIMVHNNKEELCDKLCSEVLKSLNVYKDVNEALPERIFLYRDGVGDGQLSFVYNTELEQLKEAFKRVYAAVNKPLPKLAFIVVVKRINTRFFTISQTADNPPAGTVVDDIVTLPERYDFYLVPQCSRQGTVSPVYFNVLYDTQEVKPRLMQQLSYQMCHTYYNWSGTISVPSVCQYAHKLAYLSGQCMQASSAHARLATNLYYL